MISSRLNVAARSQLVIVRAAAGAGKTAALANWAEHLSERGRPGAWSRVSSGSTTRLAFWRDVADKWGFPVRPDGPSEDDDTRVRSILEAVPDEPFTLIAIDFDTLGDPAVFDDVVDLLSDRTQLTMVVECRSWTPLEEPRLASTVDVDYINGADLAFSSFETTSALVLRGLNLSTAALTTIQNEFHGWPLGITRLSNHLALDRRPVWRDADLEGVIDRVVAELTADLTRHLRDTDLWLQVICSSALPYVSVVLGARLLGSERASREFLTAVERAGLGEWHRRQGRDRFVLIPTMKASLLREFDVHDEETLRRVRSASAELLAEFDESQEALELAVSAGDWSNASKITETAYAQLSRDDSDALLALVERIPESYRDDDPWLMILEANLRYALDGSRTSAAMTLFARAESSARELSKDALPHEVVRLSTMRMNALRHGGAFGRATLLARQVMEDLASTTSGPGRLDPRARAEACLQAGITFFVDGCYDEALQSLTDASLTGTVDPAPWLTLQALGYRALVHVLRGEVTTADGVLWSLFVQGPWESWQHSVFAVAAHLAAALTAIEHGDVRSTRTHLTVLTSLGVDFEDWPVLAYTVGLHLMISGNGYAGFAAIRDIEGRRGSDLMSNHLKSVLVVVKADLLLLAKQVQPALTTLRPFLDGRETIAGAQARALQLSGNDAKARIFADRLVWRSRLNPRVAMELQVVKAVAADRMGDLAVATTALREAEEVGRTYGLTLPWSLVPHDELVALVSKVAPDLAPQLAGLPSVFTSSLTVPALTRRESIVMRQLQGQGGIEDIAKQLGVSPNTVKTQIQSIYKKLGVNSRWEAVRVAFEWRLIDSVDPASAPARTPSTGRPV